MRSRRASRNCAGRSRTIRSSRASSRRGIAADTDSSRHSPGAPRDADGANAPRRAHRDSEQEIRFCTTSDGVSLAYSAIGTGPYIVRVLGHFTHLEAEWEWPDLRRFWEQLGGTAYRRSLRRPGNRSIRSVHGEFTEETRQRDLDAVLTAIGPRRQSCWEISEGGWTAATYAIQHPEQITHLILYGAYCRGAQARPGYDPEEDQALVTLIRKGWGRDTPAFRQVMTSQFFRSDADPALLARFNELQRLSADPDTAARYHESCHRRGDGRDMYPAAQDSCAGPSRPRGFGRERRRGTTAGVDHPWQSTRPASERNHYFPRHRSGHKGRPGDRAIPHGLYT